MHILRHHFHRGMFLAVLAFVGAYLQPSIHRHQAAFAQVAGTDLAHLAPNDDLNEIRFLCSIRFLPAINRQSEPGHRCSGCCMAQFRVSYQTTDQNNMI